MSKILSIAALCLCSGLVLAAPPEASPGGSNGHGPQRGAAPPGENRGPAARPAAQGPARGGSQHAAPADLGPARERIQALRGQIGRGGDLPPALRIERGQPLPRGYGKPLPPGIVRQLPAYPGYEWRRLGADMVLIAVGTGIVYEILPGVLN